VPLAPRFSGKRQSWRLCAAALALVALNSGCKRSAADPHPELSAPSINFQSAGFDLDGIGWMEEQADQFGVDLDVSGLRAIDKDVAFLFGGISVAAGTIRSCLLRTSDGGKSWHELMAPVSGSELTHVAFSDPLHGWALALWAVEGPGTIVLFATKDGGKTWRQLTEIQRSEGHAVPDGFPLSMTFTSERKGEIELSYDSESSSMEDIRFDIEALATDDGGATWSVVRRETRKGSLAETDLAQRDRGFDSTEWELGTRAYGEPITIRRFDREQSRWQATTLPTHFKYKQGRVLTSP